MNQKTTFLFRSAFALLATSMHSVHAAESGEIISDYQNRPAHFTVTSDVVTPDLPPFTTTINSIGNTMMNVSNGAFEPMEWRNRVQAEKSHPNRIYINVPSASHWGRLGTGFLDGASVQVFRPINDKMELVRQDTVAEGGHVVEAWSNRRLGAVKADTTSFTYAWDKGMVQGEPIWFTVFAIDHAGNFSPAAKPVMLTIPDNSGQGKVTNQHRFNYQIPRRSKDDTPPPAPTGFSVEPRPDGTVDFKWDSVDADDIQAYELALTVTDPATHRGCYFELAGSSTTAKEEIREGDMVFLAKSFVNIDFSYIWPTHRYNSNYIPFFYPHRVRYDESDPDAQKWKLVRHEANTPVEHPGETYLEVSLKEGQTFVTRNNDISTNDQTWYKVPSDHEYIIEVWLKADRPDAPPVTFKVLNARGEVEAAFPELKFQPTTEWKQFKKVVRSEIPENGGIGHLSLLFEGEGRYGLDNFRIYRADRPFLQFLPEDIERLKASGLSMLRTHAFIKTEINTYSMAQLTNEGGAIRGPKLATGEGNTLPQTLSATKDAGMQPWLQIEMHMSPAEWLGFVEYMAAPYDPSVDTPEDKPWAFKRYSQGHKEPWTDLFHTIYFEISNETWNGNFSPWTFSNMTDSATGETHDRGAVYGMFNQYVTETLRSSPWWSEEVEQKFRFVLGGFFRSHYGWQAAQHDDHADFHTIANYIRGWDGAGFDERIDSATPKNFFLNLQHAYQGTAHTCKINLRRYFEFSKGGKDIQLGTYESGPGYSFGSKAEFEAAEAINKSKAAGTSTLDNFLMSAQHGFTLQNFFTYGAGDRWTSHTEDYYGGQLYPTLLTLTLFNHHGTGDLLDVITHNVPTAYVPGSRRTVEVTNAPLATVYATRDGDRVTLFCISRQFPNYPDPKADGYTDMAIKLPFSKAEKITLHKLTGAITDTNRFEEKVKIQSVMLAKDVSSLDTFPVNEHTGADARGLPPGETYVYVFEGTDIGPEGRRVPLKEIYDRPIGFQN